MNIYDANPPLFTEKICEKKVLICGAGGLGSNVAMLLIRAGITHLTIIDFDTVNPSNLNRQFFFVDQLGERKVDALKINLLRIQPNAEIIPYFTRLSPENFAEFVTPDYDCILECFDHAESKAQLTQFVQKNIPENIPYIAMSGLAGLGPISEFKELYRHRNIVILGDGKSEADKVGTLSSRVMAAASLQAHTALTFLGR